MEEILVFLLEALAQIFLEIFGQILLELGFRGIVEVFQKREDRNPAIAFVGYLIFGLVSGGISLLIFPRSFIRTRGLRILNLVAAPIAAGLVMSGLGALQRRKGKTPLPLDSFAYGAAFALVMSLVRFLFAGH
jgi:hypothetical protein